MAEAAKGRTGPERASTAPYLRPKDAATLIIIDRSGPSPRVLMGRRHAGHRFMPGLFVFPGGRIERDDRRMPAAGELGPEVAKALAASVLARAAGRGRALALTAIRETFEETGLMLGRRTEAMPGTAPAPSWAPFFTAGVLPDLAPLAFIGRAITPPGRPRRFDTRFFAVDREAIAHEVGGVVGPEAELVELVWVDLAAARRLELPRITAVMLDELEARIAAGFGPGLPVPFYRRGVEGMTRELL